MTPDVNVVLLDFPNPGNEMVFENDDGSFTIMINSRLSHDTQLIAYHHAMKHIKNNDFQKNDVQAIETVAHTSVIPEDAQRISSDRFLHRIKMLQAERKRIQRKLAQVEAEMEVTRSMNRYNGWEIPSHQQWFG